MSDWITGNRYLSQSEMENNALIFRDYFHARGWSDEAIAGMLGNIQTESTVNPGIWENLTVNYSRGYGLVQWTPATNYIDWAGSDYESGNRQCERIIYEFDSGIQYYPTSSYPMSAANFKTSTESPAYLAYVWLYNYERPGNLDQPNRATQAENWYTYITGHEPGPGPGPGPGPTPTGKVPIWLLYKFRRW